MPEGPDITLVRDSYTALSNGSLDGLLADDVVFHVPGHGPLAGRHQGRDEVLGYLARYLDQTGGGLNLEPEAVMAGDGHIAVLVRVTGERDGEALDERGVHIFRVQDGKILERWSFPQDSYVIDEFVT